MPPQPADEYNWAAILDEEARNPDGSGNNQTDTSLGSAGEQLLRVSSASYADGAGQVVLGANPREI